MQKMDLILFQVKISVCLNLLLIKFESLSWQQIVTDDGLDYKEFSKNKKTGTYFSDDEWRAGVHKFRIDQKIRCFGKYHKWCFLLFCVLISIIN